MLKLSPLRKELDRIEIVLAELETEWEWLDSQGIFIERQREIATEMEKFYSTKLFLENYLKEKG